MDAFLDTLTPTPRMPAVFLAHGSPMNALADNAFTQSLRALGERLPRPAAVLAISAHWMTPGTTRVLLSAEPVTIHDFYGFPRELYEIEYPAPGSPEVAQTVSGLTRALPDDTWGLDHGTWTVARHVFPNADVPMLQLSLDVTAPAHVHVALARKLEPLRERGVLILGSGNIVHNLRLLRWEDDGSPYDWAREFDEWVEQRLLDGDVDALADYKRLGLSARLAAPTPDHYLPLLYAAAVREDHEPIEFTHTGLEMGSLSMRCMLVG